ncbi:MAG: NTP transferase domain-containing protein [Candidatus Omnitrophica bacterium]|nr:NTP transferase domain-containing protein [Candidatus Omnitrophota bacterium]
MPKKLTNLTVIILAAGEGKRMKSALPKVLHPVCARPMLGYVLDLVKQLKPKKTITVVGHGRHQVEEFLRGARTLVVRQKKLLGTADAVKQALARLSGSSGTVLVLYGDTPLLKAGTVEQLLDAHAKSRADITLLTARMDKPAGYGRILRDKYGSICGIAEEKDADDFQKETKEINTGIMCFNTRSLKEALKLIKPSPRTKEYYLTDAISILYRRGGIIEGVVLEDAQEAMGINSRKELSVASSLMQGRINDGLMERGVTIVHPPSACIAYGTRIGRDTVIYPFTVIERGVKIGNRCSIGPFIHLREGTTLGNEVVAGNFLEVVRSSVGAKSFIKHFSYIGDSRLGRSVNIGAGSVTANFDGLKKGNTVIGDNAFIGSDTVLVAPVKIGARAKTGAGCVVTRGKQVPPGSTVIGIPARPLVKKHTR